LAVYAADLSFFAVMAQAEPPHHFDERPRPKAVRNLPRALTPASRGV